MSCSFRQRDREGNTNYLQSLRMEQTCKNCERASGHCCTDRERTGRHKSLPRSGFRSTPFMYHENDVVVQQFRRGFTDGIDIVKVIQVGTVSDHAVVSCLAVTAYPSEWEFAWMGRA